MKEDAPDLDSVGAKLAAAFPPLESVELRSDLWPRMLRRLEDSPPRFGYPEALIAGLLILILAVFPELISMVLYNL